MIWERECMLQSIPVTEVTEQRKVYKDPLTDTV